MKTDDKCIVCLCSLAHDESGPTCEGCKSRYDKKTQPPIKTTMDFDEMERRAAERVQRTYFDKTPPPDPKPPICFSGGLRAFEVEVGTLKYYVTHSEDFSGDVLVSYRDVEAKYPAKGLINSVTVPFAIMQAVVRAELERRVTLEAQR